MPGNPIEEYGKLQWNNGFAVGFTVCTLLTIYGYMLIKVIH
jgi:hypothetical protein